MSPAVIMPTNGRVVWFRGPATTAPLDQPKAAIVVYVHNERLVNLAVFGPQGNVTGVTDVPLRQPADPEPPGIYCEWMDFQIGQASRTEQIAKAAGIAVEDVSATQA